jgi:hypothetical protein
MFTQPINQSGLSGFIPVRRQEGGVPNQELDIGQIAEFDIFGRAIPKTTTNIGQIENPQQLAPGLPQGGISSLIPVDGGADDPFVDAPDFTPPDISLDAISGKADEVGDRIGAKFDAIVENPVDWALEKGEDALWAGTRDFVTSFVPGKFSPPIVGGLWDAARDMFEGKPFDSTKAAVNLGLGFLSAAFPVLALPIMALKGLYSLLVEDEPVPFSTDVVGPFGTIPGDFDGPEDAEDLEDMGYNIDLDIAPPGTFSEESGPTSGPTGGPDGGSDAGGDVGDDPGSTACWVAGTQILMADNTYRNIEDLKIGDMVMSYPETKKTRRWNTPLEAKPIVSLLVDVHPEIWHLNDSMVSGTEWMIKEDGTAAIVQWLNVGDTVLGPDNNLVEITRVEPAEGQLKKQVIYNFETKDNYTYIADGMRTIRGRAIRGEYAPSAGRVYQVMQTYLSGDTNSYEGSMQDEYNKKFSNLAA